MNTTDKTISTYTQNDTTSGSEDAILTGMRCFSVALGHWLKHAEAVCVTLAPPPNFPNDRSGRFVVFRNQDQILINYAPEGLRAADGEVFSIGEFQ
jgi:hypothetical protein